MNKQEIKLLENRDAEGYSRMPDDVSEVAEWESEQVWAEDDLSAQQDNTARDKVFPSKVAKALRDRHIVLSKEGERGIYRLQHKGFALWIKLAAEKRVDLFNGSSDEAHT